MRECGYYWCKNEDGWDICEFVQMTDKYSYDKNTSEYKVISTKRFWIIGCDNDGNPIEEKDNYFEEIIEKRIKLEDYVPKN